MGKRFNNDTFSLSLSLSLSLHLITPNVHIRKKCAVGSRQQSRDILISAVSRRSFIREGTSLKRRSHSGKLSEGESSLLYVGCDMYNARVCEFMGGRRRVVVATGK